MHKFPVPMPPPEEILQRRRQEARRRRVCKDLVLMAAAVWLLFGQVFLIHRHQGLGMYPAVKDGDLVLACRMIWDCREGDLVVYRQEGRRYLGRVAAREGDIVMMDDSGRLLVNGTVRNGETLYPTYARETTEYPQRVPRGTVFLLGDFRTQSRDSRDFGAVPLENIQGKLWSIIRIRGL